MTERSNWRWWFITGVFNRFHRLNLAELGREWGEAEWTSRDLWEAA